MVLRVFSPIISRSLQQRGWDALGLGSRDGIALISKINDGLEGSCKHTRFSSTHFLRFPGFQPSAGTLLASGYSGIHGAAHCYIQPAIAQ